VVVETVETQDFSPPNPVGQKRNLCPLSVYSGWNRPEGFWERTGFPGKTFEPDGR